MPPRDEPTSPLEAYRQIIDELAAETSHGVSEQLVKQSGIYSKALAAQAANDLVAALSAEQRQVLADMLHKERTSAIHDVLALLQWWTDCRDVQLTFQGKPIPLTHYDSLHMAYVGRQLGNPWPGEEDSGPPEAYPKASEDLAKAAEADAKITDKKCPHCGQPCPSYRKTCKHCRKPVKTV